MLAEIERLWGEVEAKRNALPKPTGTREEIAVELLRRAAERDADLARLAIESERAGDEDYTWVCMAGRAENNRLRQRIYEALPHLKPV